MHLTDSIAPILSPLQTLSGAGLGLAAFGILFFLGLCVLARRARHRTNLERARDSAQEVAGNGVLVVRANGHVIEANGLARRLLWPDGSQRAQLLLPEPILVLLSDSDRQNHTVRIGRNQLIDLSISCRLDRGDIRGIVLRDITEDQRGRDHLLQLAHYDSLTGLGNRRLFIDRLKLATRRARDDGESVALLYIDIDRFKEVNDSLGHGAGDELLKVVASRFRSQMQSWQERASRGEYFVARLSGDEFAIVVLDGSDERGVQRLAEGILAATAEPIVFEGRSIPCSASMGIALLPDHGSDVEDLVKAADAALYVAKETGRGRSVVYQHAFRAQAEYARRVENGLRQAIETGELRLCYQPKVEVASGTVAGFEALLRWQSDELGSVSPKDFIPIAEERGLICAIGAWCIDEACRQLGIWREAGFEIVPVSVNVSSAQFAEADLQSVITKALVRHDIPPGVFEIELTESLILDDNETTALTLRDLRAIGVRVSLDDFGTGYSALTYLNRFPLDTVKMDRGFLRGIEDDEGAAGIASAVVSMSHSLGFSVVAEGVDCERQAQLLRSMGCDQIQGFLYSPALPALEATRFLAPQGGRRPIVPSSSTASAIDQILAPSEVGIIENRPQVALASPGVGRCADRVRARSIETRMLVIDDESGSLGQIVVRLMRLGADTHFVQGIDEASVFVEQDEPLVDLLVASPAIDVRRLCSLRERLEKMRAEKMKTRVLVVGESIDDARRNDLRQARIDWLVVGPVEDVELRFFIGAARFETERPWHQRAVRVPLETTGWIRVAGERRIGTLTSLSRRGAFLETTDPYEIGQSVRLEFKTAGSHVRVFGNVSYRHEMGPDTPPHRPAGIGVVFYEPDDSTTHQIDTLIEQIWSRHLP